ncbi:MAG: NAD(P)H-dependent glycerol-3-phosphate dehydrogenase [bacterium]
MEFGVIGAGSWGTAFAGLLAEKQPVGIWDVQDGVLEQIAEKSINEQYLPGVELPDKLRPVKSAEELVESSRALVIAVPSHSFRQVVDNLSETLPELDYVVVLTKGFDPASSERLSAVYKKLTGTLDNYYLVTGPSHAGEVARKRPSTVVVGGKDEEGRKNLQDLFFRPYFRVYTNPDLVGLEMGGALKNIIAIAAGIADGLDFGVNARAALITRGMNDLREIAEFEGASPRTLYGLSGLGDLIVTATSELSRNYSCGQLIAGGASADEAKEEIGQVVEGIKTTASAMRRIEKGDLRAPIIRMVDKVLQEEISPRRAVEKLMNRRARREF